MAENAHLTFKSLSSDLYSFLDALLTRQVQQSQIHVYHICSQACVLVYVHVCVWVCVHAHIHMHVYFCYQIILGKVVTVRDIETRMYIMDIKTTLAFQFSSS